MWLEEFFDPVTLSVLQTELLLTLAQLKIPFGHSLLLWVVRANKADLIRLDIVEKVTKRLLII